MQRFLAGLFLLSSLVVPSQADAASGGTLTVTISGLGNQQGQVCFSLFSGRQGFPSNGAYAIQASCVSATSTPVVLTFQHLNVGNYAVAVFHDNNGDGILNRNWLGIPTEAFGFSQNPRILTSAPQFGDSAVLVAGSQTAIQIRLQSL
jgi:uncharacterized protein (DUF2141 family)